MFKYGFLNALELIFGRHGLFISVFYFVYV